MSLQYQRALSLKHNLHHFIQENHWIFYISWEASDYVFRFRKLKWVLLRVFETFWNVLLDSLYLRFRRAVTNDKFTKQVQFFPEMRSYMQKNQMKKDDNCAEK